MKARTILIGLALVSAAAVVRAGAGGGGEDLCAKTVRILTDQYKSLKSLKAHFRHTLKAPALNQEEMEEGTLYLAQGGKMRWEYSSPEGKLAIADGKSNFLYLPAEKQVYAQSLQTGEKAPLTMRLLTGQVDLGREVVCRSAQASGREVFLQLELASKDAGVQDLEVTFDTPKGTMTSVRYKDALGNEVAVTLSEIELGLPLSSSLFEFKIPDGVQVLRGE